MDNQVKFVHGLLSGIGGVVLKSALNIIFIPVIIYYLGAEYFGFYVFLIGLSELLVTLDLGLAWGLIHRLSHYRGQGDDQMVQEQLCVGQWLYGMLALLMAFFGIMISPCLIPFFHLSPSLLPIANMVFALIMIDAAVNLYSSYFRSVLMAHSLYHWTNLAEIFQSILCNFLGFALLLGGWGLVAILWGRVAVSLLQMFFLMRQALKVEAHALWPKSPFKANAFKDLWTVSIHSMILKISAILSTRLDTAVIAMTLGMTAVAIYNIVFRIFGQISYLSIKISEGVFPVFARFSSLSKQSEARFFFLRMSCFLNFMVGFLMIWIVQYYQDILQFLAQGKISYAASLPIVWVAIPIVWSSVLVSPATHYLFVNKRFSFQTTLSIVTALVNLGMSLILVQWVGLIGVALGTLIPHVSEHQFLLIPRTCREMQIPKAEYWRTVYGKNILPWLIALCSFLAFHPLYLRSSHSPLVCCVIGTISLCLSGLTWYYYGASEAERRLAEDKILVPAWQKIALKMRTEYE